MSALLAQTLTRVRACVNANLPLPVELGIAILESTQPLVDARQVRAQRDELIRQAAGALPDPDALVEELAARLEEEAKLLQRRWATLCHTRPSEPYSSARDFLHAARLIKDIPSSQRQFRRILKAPGR
jgi:hypothetical protein